MLSERLLFGAILLFAIASIGCKPSAEQLKAERSKAAREMIAKRHHVADEVKNVLNNSDRFMLFSIQGVEGAQFFVDAIPPDVTSDTKFHGYDILGKTDIEDPVEQKSLVEALYQSIAESTGPALCFSPRHAIRAVKGDDIVDLVICFECFQIRVFTESQKVLGEHSVWTSDKPAGAFDAALSRRNIRLASPPEAKSQ
jgi:hypothetical protein